MQKKNRENSCKNLQKFLDVFTIARNIELVEKGKLQSNYNSVPVCVRVCVRSKIDYSICVCVCVWARICMRMYCVFA